MFSKRLIEPEMLDHAPPEVARPNLADLVKINRRFGGHTALRETLSQLAAKSDHFTLLDIGAASGDSARVLQELYPAAVITSLDQNATNLEWAPAPKVLADAFALPFGDGSFDFVYCSLFLHHFENAVVVELLRSFYARARRALLVCDLERHLVPWMFLPASRPFLKWNAITVSDGVKSVRAGFRVGELNALAERAGLRNIHMRRYRPAFRIALTAKK